MVSRTFSALCVNSKFGHPPHPLGDRCAKFHFFRGLHCWASPCRKIAYSITQSLTHPAYLMSQEPKCLHFGKINCPKIFGKLHLNANTLWLTCLRPSLYHKFWNSVFNIRNRTNQTFKSADKSTEAEPVGTWLLHPVPYSCRDAAEVIIFCRLVSVRPPQLTTNENITVHTKHSTCQVYDNFVVNRPNSK